MNFTGRSLFSKPGYPYRFDTKNLVKIVATQFVLVFLFLFLFKPFGVNEAEHKYSYFIICVIHAIVPAIVVYTYFNLLNHFKKPFKISEWTLSTELVHLAAVFFLIGIFSFLSRSLIYNNANNWSFSYLVEEVRNTYLAGGLLSSYLIFARSYSLFNLHTELSQNLIVTAGGGDVADQSATIDQPENKQNHHAEIFIKAHVKIDDFIFNPTTFLFAKAEGNYSELAFFKEGQLKKELKRISLKQLELQLAVYPHIIRCHRAYLLNVEQVIKASGNSQGYVVSFNGIEENAPVSRIHLTLFDQLYRQLLR